MQYQVNVEPTLCSPPVGVAFIRTSCALSPLPVCVCVCVTLPPFVKTKQHLWYVVMCVSPLSTWLVISRPVVLCYLGL